VRAWTASVGTAQQWPPAVADGFTSDIVSAFQSGEPLDVWETYDQLREALVVAIDDTYLEQLRKRVTHVPAQD
jgi:hypothetical protein